MSNITGAKRKAPASSTKSQLNSTIEHSSDPPPPSNSSTRTVINSASSPSPTAIVGAPAPSPAPASNSMIDKALAATTDKGNKKHKSIHYEHQFSAEAFAKVYIDAKPSKDPKNAETTFKVQEDEKNTFPPMIATEELMMLFQDTAGLGGGFSDATPPDQWNHAVKFGMGNAIEDFEKIEAEQIANDPSYGKPLKTRQEEFFKSYAQYLEWFKKKAWEMKEFRPTEKAKLINKITENFMSALETDDPSKIDKNKVMESARKEFFRNFQVPLKYPAPTDKYYDQGPTITCSHKVWVAPEEANPAAKKKKGNSALASSKQPARMGKFPDKKQQEIFDSLVARGYKYNPAKVFDAEGSLIPPPDDLTVAQLKFGDLCKIIMYHRLYALAPDKEGVAKYGIKAMFSSIQIIHQAEQYIPRLEPVKKWYATQKFKEEPAKSHEDHASDPSKQNGDAANEHANTKQELEPKFGEFDPNDF